MLEVGGDPTTAGNRSSISCIVFGIAPSLYLALEVPWAASVRNAASNAFSPRFLNRSVMAACNESTYNSYLTCSASKYCDFLSQLLSAFAALCEREGY